MKSRLRVGRERLDQLGELCSMLHDLREVVAVGGLPVQVYQVLDTSIAVALNRQRMLEQLLQA